MIWKSESSSRTKGRVRMAIQRDEDGLHILQRRRDLGDVF